jgi:hypothetical protein
MYIKQFFGATDDFTVYRTLAHELALLDIVATEDNASTTTDDNDDDSTQRSDPTPTTSTAGSQPPLSTLGGALAASRVTPTSGGLQSWSQHQKHGGAMGSKCFRQVIQRLASDFSLRIGATRLNIYQSGSAWKPLHKDSHAFVPSLNAREDLTVGASFGAPRELLFRHDASSLDFVFPQENNDVFAFTSRLNSKFMHGVPKPQAAISALDREAPRFSVIVWGVRFVLNRYNSGLDERQATATDDDHDGAVVPSSTSIEPDPFIALAAPPTASISLDQIAVSTTLDRDQSDKRPMADMVQAVEQYIQASATRADEQQKKAAARLASKSTQATASKRKPRVQSGWSVPSPSRKTPTKRTTATVTKPTTTVTTKRTTTTTTAAATASSARGGGASSTR